MSRVTQFILFVLLFGVIWMTATNLNIPKQGDLENASHQVLELINQERQRLNVNPLIWDNKLAELARLHSQYMADSDEYRHSRYGYTENIMIGAKPKEVYSAWKNSPRHYANMTDGNLAYAGIGMGIKLTNITIGSIDITINTSRSFTTFIAK
jgi:uncharacterized protein YkwD